MACADVLSSFARQNNVVAIFSMARVRDVFVTAYNVYPGIN